MGIEIHLLGSPTIRDVDGERARFRSRKSWGLLAHLLLTERPTSRTRLASMLFSEADDPLRALRWNLSEIRRALGETVLLEGDPLELQLPPDTVVDVRILTDRGWEEIVDLPGFGEDLLAGMAFRDAAAFESWLFSEQRHLAAVTEAVLHEAARASRTRGNHRAAIEYAVGLVERNPFDENHQAMLIGAYRASGDQEAAARQYDATVELFQRELGVTPGRAVVEALREKVPTGTAASASATAEALVEAGTAAISAGAVDAGVDSLRLGLHYADESGSERLRARARLALAEVLIHSVRGMDEEGTAYAFEADELASEIGADDLAAAARAELGYVDYLRARYDRAEVWFAEALALADQPISARVETYLGSVKSDRAEYPAAVRHLSEGIRLAELHGNRKAEAYARSMLGRVHLLRGGVDSAIEELDASIAIADADRWLAFLPWPQALRGEAEMALSPEQATPMFDQAFARACQLGDPCWEGLSARGLARAAEHRGEIDAAFAILADARIRTNRFSDPYVWLDVSILDTLCTLGRRHHHPETKAWVEEMQTVASRTGMRELVVRSLLHGHAVGRQGDGEAAEILAAEIENPVLERLVESSEDSSE